jgi:hypothetical protein
MTALLNAATLLCLGAVALLGFDIVFTLHL